ncbi:thiolase C-terminal domain-containing protein [Dehalogenimonas alkenigignens]|uniref:Acetyl-CoA acetyltransferase n=1 Tax=Dehalogenimonas alkenigignens TaxID=1217799 RepID=A0A0W0GGF1_9CHLR|nr:propanoyl-CoA acyltransferase [Dehalogenimonas alkenigignens]KTB47634.1 Acetyl-CoA acetyltransferase [Dehalogenimonas alkenigignens]PVV82828.1 propanoyl-CoA acyltransferase [Dehalogenimonas alkenigignens]
MRKVAVIGVGQTRFSGAQGKSLSELFAEAAFEALADAHIESKSVQALFVGNALGDFAEGQGMTPAFIADYIGAWNVPANRYDGACASASVAIRDAFLLVAAGVYDIVIAGGVERAASLGTPLATRTFAMFSDSRYEFPAGMTFPGVFALLAHRYAAVYGLPIEKLKEQMAQVSVQSYNHGMFNPKAHLKKSVTIPDVLKSFTVATPIQLHDCCPFSDGAAAVVVASEEAAKTLSPRPVFIAGAGQASSGPLASQGAYLPRLKARELSARQAYAMAGITPADIDVCELHDCFSIAGIIAAEGLGFFEQGKAGEAWLKGEADIGGKVAINPSGGLKSKGHPIGATGAAQVYEVVRQLRGEVEPERQVPEARIGMTDTLGGDGGTMVSLIFKRGW